MSDAMTTEALDELAAFYDPEDPATARAQWRHLFTSKSDGPIAVLNRLVLRERAAYDDGREATGADALMAYAAVSIPALAKVGGRFLVSGGVLAPLFGSGADADLVVVGWYPNRAALLALLRDPEYRAAFAHRRAAVASQWVVATEALS
jgi:uncharacterized protein (DUF1330 family)